jgi:hypothetical protein
VGGRIILKWISKTESEDANRVYLAEDRVQWRVLVNTVVNLRIKYRRRWEICLLIEGLLTSEGELSRPTMELVYVYDVRIPYSLVKILNL